MRAFSPISRVSFEVEPARVEQRTDLDKLVLDIETDGSIDPEEAVRSAARILIDQMSIFADLQGTPVEEVEENHLLSTLFFCIRWMIWN